MMKYGTNMQRKRHCDMNEFNIWIIWMQNKDRSVHNKTVQKQGCFLLMINFLIVGMHLFRIYNRWCGIYK